VTRKPEYAQVEVQSQDFIKALEFVKPSVSMEELKKYEEIKGKFSK
jgi:SpoVK/Ycf46/Vps4 family AAA+-type ATPase